jgi:hypothetical protein
MKTKATAAKATATAATNANFRLLPVKREQLATYGKIPELPSYY